MDNKLVSNFTLRNILEALGSLEDFTIKVDTENYIQGNQIILIISYSNEQIQSHNVEVFKIVCSKELSSFISKHSISFNGDIISKNGNVVNNIRDFFLIEVKKPDGNSYIRISTVCYISLDGLLKVEEQEDFDRFNIKLKQLILTLLPQNSNFREKIFESEEQEEFNRQEYLYLQNINDGQGDILNEVLNNADSIISLGKVIAKFMGELVQDDEFGGSYIKKDGKFLEIDYHKSWDKIMSVYHKITYEEIYPVKKIVEDYSDNLMKLKTSLIDKNLIQLFKDNIENWEKLNYLFIPPNDKNTEYHLEIFFREIAYFIISFNIREDEYKRNDKEQKESQWSIPTEYEKQTFNDEFYNDNNDLDDQSLEFWNSI